MDAPPFQFPNEEEARYFLPEDEFSELSTLDEEDERDLGRSHTSLVEAMMYVKIN